jgi:hypothetical protein
MSYRKMLPLHQYYHDVFEEWKELEQDMYIKHQNLLNDEPMMSETHYELTFEDSCVLLDS